MYKCVVSDLWSLGVSNASPVFFGVSAGVLSTMVLLTSMLEDTSVLFSTPIGVFIAGAWHPKAHYRFGKAVLSSDCRVLVVNHRQDYYCSWREQASFWQQLAIEYRDLQLEVIKVALQLSCLVLVCMIWAVVLLLLVSSGTGCY